MTSQIDVIDLRQQIAEENDKANTGFPSDLLWLDKKTSEHAARKATPICTGVLDYFPRALAEISRVSRAGSEQQNPGKPMHWDRSKSKDEPDALVRHLLKRGTFDTDGQRHSAKMAWRALALLEKELEGEKI